MVSGASFSTRPGTPGARCWCGSGAITEADYATLKQPNLSRFIYDLGDRRLIDDAIGTIEEHHPGQTIWIEAASSN